MKTVASAPGKLVVLGEFAVLAGAPAIVVGVDRRARVTVAPADEWRLEAPGLGITGLVLEPVDGRVPPPADPELASRLAVVGAALEAALAFVAVRGGRLAPQAITTDTSAFVTAAGEKLGLGASAAVATALFAALVQRGLGVVPRSAELLQEVVAAHRRAQGGGSGVDVAASVFGGTLVFDLDHERRPSVRLRELPSGLRLIAAWSGTSQSTPMVLRALDAWRARDPAGHAAHLATLTTLARAGVEALARGARDFASAAHAYAEAVDALGQASGVELVSPTHRRLGAIVAAAGGVYKPSGAGGDLGLALCAGRGVVDAVTEALAREHITTVPAQPVTGGVTVASLE
jgi:phosphomevalonate kinase